MEIKCDVVTPKSGLRFEKDNFPNLSWFIYLGDVHQVLEWRSESTCRVFDYGECRQATFESDSSATYYPVSNLHIRAEV